MAETKPDYPDLMRRANAGDTAAYRVVLEASTRLLRPYLQKRLAQKSDAEDVLQEILVSVHKARHTYDGNRPFAPWLFAIAHFRLQDHLRKLYADPLRNAGEIEEAENIPANDVTGTGISYESIEEEVNRLPGKAPVILKMIHSEGYTAKEAGEKLGMKESAVKVAAHRAYKILRQKLGG